MAHYRASRAFSTATSLAESSEFVARHSPAIKLMGSVFFGAMVVTAYITSLLGKRDLAVMEEATQRVLADLEARRQREVNEQRARVETLERVLGILYHLHAPES
ncbi:hypothetical protein CHLRE_03g209169v5 [Chlamydomonas reinhardtii]|uniref:Uncharacterized protein n=1 Tax=Chlamydomonas reinhardtii TaxID=3055 RepID=A0A2K3DZU2_CHLRE|nr:uncharacterized protein CHLRE_03g209169v5 [Chlamydomonas reinhardtii]PNW86053.1 hypothetical protein CHLRE_03g209169v5 [Chlamydomonas reinhardtii]